MSANVKLQQIGRDKTCHGTASACRKVQRRCRSHLVFYAEDKGDLTTLLRGLGDDPAGICKSSMKRAGCEKCREGGERPSGVPSNLSGWCKRMPSPSGRASGWVNRSKTEGSPSPRPRGARELGWPGEGDHYVLHSPLRRAAKWGKVNYFAFLGRPGPRGSRRRPRLSDISATNYCTTGISCLK